MERLLIVKAAVAATVLGLLVGCGGSSSSPGSATSTTSIGVTAGEFRAAVVRLWLPLKYADPSKASPSALAAKFDGFAAAVEAEPVPHDEISNRAAIASAARGAASQIRSETDLFAYGGAVGAAQGTIASLIKELPR